MYINNVSSSYFTVVSLREHQVDRGAYRNAESWKNVVADQFQNALTSCHYVNLSRHISKKADPIQISKHTKKMPGEKVDGTIFIFSWLIMAL